MTNLSLISVCNRKCSYCFAADVMHASAADRQGVSLPQLEAELDFLCRSGMSEARLLGGEPTLHPQFSTILDRVLARGMSLLVFSGGMIPKAALTRMADLPLEKLRVLLNVAVPGRANPAELARQREVCRCLGPRVALGINIDSPAVELDFLLEMIGELNLARVVRMGLAHPIVGADNDHLHPRYFDLIGQRVADFALRARDRGVKLEFDCGWVPCMFPPGSLEELGITPDEVGRRCNPILDVMPDGTVIHCYPLASEYQERLSDHADAKSLADRFTERVAPIRPLGIFRKCAECDFRARGDCTGGCMSLALRRARPVDFSISFPEGASASADSLAAAEVPELVPLSYQLPVISPSPAGCCQHQHQDTSSICESPKSTPIEIQGTPESSQRCRSELSSNRWSLPYIDRPVDFWDELQDEYGRSVSHVYFPLPGDIVGSGRPPQPDQYLTSFLRSSRTAKAVLLNAVTLPRPVGEVAGPIIEALRRLREHYDISEAVVASLLLAQRIRDALPEIRLTASVLMEISEPIQARLLNGVCDTLVPASRVVRDLPALKALRAAFHGRIRLLVNEACLPGCPHRTQHFHEMASGVREPKSLCVESLQAEPWLRLTGSWVLPQHLHHYAGVYDELKLAGRVTLQHPETYRRVVDAYVKRLPLLPHEIGGGPASVLEPIDISDELFAYTLTCGRRCHECTRCADHYAAEISRARERREIPHVQPALPILNCW